MKTSFFSHLCVVLMSSLCCVFAFQASGFAFDEVRVLGEDETNSIIVQTGRARTVSAPWIISQIAVAEPEIADIQALGLNDLYVLGRSPGITDLTIWGENGQIWHARVVVEEDLAILNSALQAMFPNAQVTASRTQDVLCVQGVLRNKEQAEQLHRFLEVSGIKFVDMTRIAGIHQVQVRVRVAEANRVAMRNLGVNMFHIAEKFFGALTVGSESGGAINPIPMGVGKDTPVMQGLPFMFTSDMTTSPLVTLMASFPEEDLTFFIQALAENQYLRILAEPNLVAVSGEEASFLAGGEFPIPVVQGSSGNASVTIEYKEFGVRLRFLPEVLGDGTIRLYVAPEVSVLSDVGAIELQGFRVPSVMTRRAESTVILQSGQSFAIAGLLSESTDARKSRVPLMGDLPILGSMFRSVRYQRGETELVVLVTASLVEPLSSQDNYSVPGDLHIPPNDWEMFLFGFIEGRPSVRSTGLSSGPEPERLRMLRGPGGFAAHNDNGQRRAKSANVVP